MPGAREADQQEVRTAEVIGALCLATDMGTGLPLEHGLHSTLIAMRLAERLDVDSVTAAQTYYACLLFYVGCTADAEVVAELFEPDALPTHFAPVMFGSRLETMGGIRRALEPPGGLPPVRVLRSVARLPGAVRGHQSHIAALCEVAQMLTDRLGNPANARDLFGALTERWDGKGEPRGISGDELPLPLRIVHVARDAATQQHIGGVSHAAQVIRSRAGKAFDPAIATLLADEAIDVLSVAHGRSVWEDTMAAEPGPPLMLNGAALDEALAAIGDFADLASPYLVGHSSGVADLASAAGERLGLDVGEVRDLRRSALLHDLGRVAVPPAIWQKAGPLTTDDWERVRLHAYHTERVLSPAPDLAVLAVTAGRHHERLDGSGYHRGCGATEMPPTARVLAAADAYHAMTEPRPHRAPLPDVRAVEALGEEASRGRLDVDAVAGVLEAAGQRPPRLTRPAGLTEREVVVVALLARGLQTKQIAHVLGISAKTADRHIQHAYGKIGVSTRAAAALFAMQHGLIAWGELPMARAAGRP